LVLSNNTILTFAAWFWFNDLRFAAYPQGGGATPLRVLAQVNAGLLGTTYFALVVQTVFQGGYHYAWDEYRGELGFKQPNVDRETPHYPSQSPMVANRWLRLWDLSIHFH
jgi:hypothetical protein